MLVVASLLISTNRRAGFLREEATLSLKEIVNKANTAVRVLGVVDPTIIYKHHA
jgi:hypothetical protein